MSGRRPEDGYHVGEATLGQVVKGARLGWGYCAEVAAFVRIEDAADGFLIDARPGAMLPRDADRDHVHRVWWSDGPTSDVVGEAVRRIVAGGLRTVHLRRALRFIVDANGAPVASLQFDIGGGQAAGLTDSDILRCEEVRS